MANITIKKVLDQSFNEYKGVSSKTNKSYTVYSIKCDIEVDGKIMNSQTVKTMSGKVKDLIKEGAVLSSEYDERNGYVSWNIKAADNNVGGGGGGGYQKRNNSYTFKELTDMFDASMAHVISRCSFSEENMVKLTVTLFLSAQNGNAKIGIENNETQNAQPPIQNQQQQTPKQNEDSGPGVRELVMQLGVPAEKVNQFISQYKKELKMDEFKDTLVKWQEEYFWDTELDKLNVVKK